MKNSFVTPFFLVVCLLALRPGSAQAQCIVATTDTINIGSLLMGGFITDTFDVVVRKPMRIRFSYLDSMSSDAIEILSPGPSVASVDSGRVTIRYRFTQELDGLRGYRLSITDSSDPDSCTTIITFVSNGVSPTPVDTVYSIFNSDIPVIALATQEDTIVQEIEIRNNLNGTVIIETIKVDDTKHFAIGELPTLPRILDPGQSIKFDLFFFSDTGGFFETGVRLPSDHGLASEYFGVQVLSTITQGVVPPVQGPGRIYISQTANELTIRGLDYEQGEVEIYDILGRLVLRHEHRTANVSFSKHGNDGQRLTEGSYVIRLTDVIRRKSETVKLLLLGL